MPDLRAANQVLKARRVDGVVLDWVLPESEGIEFIEKIQASSALPVPPVVVSGTRKLTDQQVAAIHRCARAGPVRYAPTIERLLDETVLLLHRPLSALTAEQKKTLDEVRESDAMLAGRKVLVIDDDLRNNFRADQRTGTSRPEDHPRRERPRAGNPAFRKTATTSTSC